MKFFIFIILFPMICIGQISNSLSGNIVLYTAYRTSDIELIRLPYRLVNINFQHQNNNLQWNSTIAIEHHLRKDTETLSNSNPQDISFDLREMYLSWFTSFGEINIGKKIHSWGMVDENSPLDNINAYDYYYLFIGGSDKKIGSYSLSSDIYYNSWKFGFLFTPLHSTNRIPLNESDFPIELAAIPEQYQILPIKKNLSVCGSLKAAYLL